MTMEKEMRKVGKSEGEKVNKGWIKRGIRRREMEERRREEIREEGKGVTDR